MAIGFGMAMSGRDGKPLDGTAQPMRAMHRRTASNLAKRSLIFSRPDHLDRNASQLAWFRFHSECIQRARPGWR